MCTQTVSAWDDRGYWPSLLSGPEWNRMQVIKHRIWHSDQVKLHANTSRATRLIISWYSSVIDQWVEQLHRPAPCAGDSFPSLLCSSEAHEGSPLFLPRYRELPPPNLCGSWSPHWLECWMTNLRTHHAWDAGAGRIANKNEKKQIGIDFKYQLWEKSY